VCCDGPFDPHEFVRDLVAELRRLAEPSYPQKSWWIALAFADERDIHRSVRAHNAAGDDAYFERQHTYRLSNGDPDPRDSLRNGTQVPQVNVCAAPHPAFDARRNAKPASEFVRITKWERGRRRTYSRRDLVQPAAGTAKGS
jgi:hypothetical protein